MNSRNHALDVLRGIAVLMVMGRHMDGAGIWSSAGWCGVDLFFVLSGFLISGLLFAEFKETGSIAVKRFWIRRGFKIYPGFYVLLTVTALFFIGRAGTVPKEMLGDVFFLQGYAPHVWEHGWSLAVEEHFYLVLPLLLILLLRIRDGLRAIPLISIGVSVLCLYLRFVTSHHTQDWERVAFPTHLRCDGLFAGVALGYFAHFDPDSFRQGKKFWLPLAGIPLVLAGVFLPMVVGLTLIYVGFAFVVAWAANQQRSTNPALKLLARVGFYSYSINLWHPAVALRFYIVSPHWWKFPAYSVSAVFFGVGMAKLIELPSLKIRERLFPSGGRTRNEVVPESEGEPVIA